MAEPVFTQSGTSQVYLLTYGNTTINTAGYWPGSSIGSSISLSASWATGKGVYLFFGEVVTDIAVFAQQLQVFLQQSSSAYLRFLWIKNPNATAASWQYYTLQVNNNATYGVGLFTFGSYLLSVGGTCAISLQNDGTNYWLSITQAQGQSFFFLETQNGQYRYPLTGNTVQLSYKQGLEGSWQFQFAVGGSNNASFDTLDAGLRYYIDDPSYPNALQSLRYPVLSNPATAFTLNGNFDPVNHFVASRTFLQFAATGTAIDSFYRTNLGQLVTLTPAAQAGFVFAALPQYKNDSSQNTYTMTPCGSFTIGLPGSTAAGPANVPVGRLMLGQSGVEYAGLMLAANNLLTFYPGQPSYATSFNAPAQQSLQRTPNIATEPLSSIGTTSWVFITPPSNSNINYYAQPDGSTLFEAGNVQYPAYFGYMEVLAGVFMTTLPPTSLEDLYQGFPSVPFVGIADTDVSNYRSLELQVISTTRRARIKKLVQQQTVNKTGDAYGITPQGLKVGLDSARTFWKSVTLAHTGADSAAGQAEQRLQFTNITGNFKAALQSNQLFMVARNAEVFLEAASTNFMLTRLASAELLAAGVPATVLCNARKNPSMEGKLYTDKDSFSTDLKGKLGDTDFEQYKSLFYQYSSKASLMIGEEEYYDLSTADVNALNSCGSGWSIPANVLSLLAPVVNKQYAKAASYIAAVTAAIGAGNWQIYGYLLLEYGRVVTNGWTFNLSPYAWEWSNDNPTLLIYKYSGRSVLDMAADSNSWSWQEVAQTPSSNLRSTQEMLLAILNNALSAQAAGVKDFDDFVKAITDDKWNGILALNCKLSLDSLPQELQGLAAGVDQHKFYGHHLGINITSAFNNNGVPELKDTALFGLVYYDDPVDQYNEGSPYGFKVLSLKVLFRNSVIVDFFSQVELMINQVFGEPCMMNTSVHGNNLRLNGSYQKHDGKASYVFTQNDQSIYQVTSAVLDQVEIDYVQFVTVIPPDGLDPGGTVQTKFILNGKLRFNSIPYFDCFSFGNTYNLNRFKLKSNNTKANTKVADGYLSFSNLVIGMRFPQEKPTEKTFIFDAVGLSFDLTLSKPREESFYSHFPLDLSGMIQQTGDTQKPGDLGYMSVVTPLNPGNPEKGWYGFTYTLNLGSLGSLAGDAGFSVGLFIGWQPTGNDKPNIYIGVSLPGSSTGNNKIPIEGLLNLVFRKIEIIANEVPPAPNTGAMAGWQYMLKFRGISLSLFSFSFPPGLLDVYVFGNPGTKRSALGWYAAYAKDESDDNDDKKIALSTP